MFTDLKERASCAFNWVKERASCVFDAVKDHATHAACAGAALLGITLAEPAYASLPAIPDVGIDIGGYAESAGLVLGGHLGSIIAVSFGFVVVFIAVLWFKRFVGK